MTFGSGDGSSASSALQGMRILVVDDEPASRDVIRYVLEREGATVAAAASAAAAFEFLDATTPDVLLVDLAMPVVDGFTFVEQLRRRPADAGGTIPVAALTGYLSSYDQDRARRAC